jgi:hypothetical protein
MEKNLFFIIAIVFVFRIGISQEIYLQPQNISTRWASAENWKGEKGKGGMTKGGRKGSAAFSLKAGTTQVLAEASGTSGIIRRIWITINPRTPKILRGVEIEMYWDGAVTPAVSAPLGDFFCQGLGEMRSFQNEYFSSPEARSFNSFIPMPFRKSMKILVRNKTDENITMFYDVDYTLGDKPDKNMLYFHSYFNHQEQTDLKSDYEILPKLSGKGRFLGVMLSVIANQKDNLTTWWGEGEVKMYLDGDTDFPTLCGTGTEDYIGTGYGLGEYSHRYQGCTLADQKGMRYVFYRFHVPDPVYFYSDIKVTIQQIGFSSDKRIFDEFAKMDRPNIKTGENSDPIDFSLQQNYIMFERSDDFSSCAYFYLSTPEHVIYPKNK